MLQVNYFLKSLLMKGRLPVQLMSPSIELSRNDAEFIGTIRPNMLTLLEDFIMQDCVKTYSMLLNYSFQDLKDASQRGTYALVSLLYYHGMITIDSELRFSVTHWNVIGKRGLIPPIPLRIANRSQRDEIGWCLSLARRSRLSTPDLVLGEQAGKDFFEKGDIKPVCEWLTDHWWGDSSRRLYHAGKGMEAVLQSCFGDVLSIYNEKDNDPLYEIRLEHPLEGKGKHNRLVDMLILRNPAAVDFANDFLLEFKYAGVGSLKLPTVLDSDSAAYASQTAEKRNELGPVIKESELLNIKFERGSYAGKTVGDVLLDAERQVMGYASELRKVSVVWVESG